MVKWRSKVTTLGCRFLAQTGTMVPAQGAALGDFAADQATHAHRPSNMSRIVAPVLSKIRAFPGHILSF